jgi:mannose-6-phosphate isomerase-like protein (cupin superfamily)
MIQSITHQDKLIALIIHHNYNKSGVNFLTPSCFSQQLAFIKHAPGHIIEAHTHNEVSREVFYTQEVLILKKGKLRVDLYAQDQHYLESHVLEAGDVILLAAGGHGFEVLEELEMIEVKQGPFIGDDKIRFQGIQAEVANLV